MDIYDNLIEEKIESAKSGEILSGRWLMEEFCAIPIANGRVNLPVRMFEYFRECFNQILQGIEADKALSTRTSESGRPKNEELDKRDIGLCAEVVNLIRNSNGKSNAKIYKEIAERHDGVGDKTVKNAYLRYRILFDLLERLDNPE